MPARSLLEQINDLPVKKVNGTIIYMRDVAYVHQGSPPQTNLVRVNGSRAVLMTILKAGSASTLQVIDGIKSLLPRVEESLPASLNLRAVGDQSIFVKAAVFGVIREAALAAALVGVMILLFLGSWRSTVIILIEIPLAILFSLTRCPWLGETINVMTLGGLALAVGILVDDGTVTIENINYHLEQGKPIEPAILDGAQQIVDPGLRDIAVPLHRVRADVPARRRRRLSVPADGRGGGVRADRLVHPVAHARADAWPIICCGRMHAWPHDPWRRSATPTRNPLKRFQQGFEARFHALARPLSRTVVARAWPPENVHRRLSRLRRRSRSASGRFSARISSRPSIPGRS